MNQYTAILSALRWDPTGKGLTRQDLASVAQVSKPTVKVLIAKLRKVGHDIKTRRVRQGKRGPAALSYYIKEDD